MVDINSLIQSAKEEEVFDNLHTLDIIKASGLQNIEQNFGITGDQFKSNEVLLVQLLIDDSSSISQFGLEKSICDGQNIFVDEMEKLKDRKDILVAQSTLNMKHPIHPFVEISDVVRLTSDNYYPCGMTPYYDKGCELLSTMALKAKVDFADCGYPCRSIFCLITDGEPTDNSKTAEDFKMLVNEFGESIIVFFMGIKGNKRVDYKESAKRIGVNEKNILTPDSSPDEIKEAFRTISRSISSASKSSNYFSKAASVGGFAD